eukprot:scaffold7139_cov101-Isochrysis_galbana.AAC.2
MSGRRGRRGRDDHADLAAQKCRDRNSSTLENRPQLVLTASRRRGRDATHPHPAVGSGSVRLWGHRRQHRGKAHAARHGTEAGTSAAAGRSRQSGTWDGWTGARRAAAGRRRAQTDDG